MSQTVKKLKLEPLTPSEEAWLRISTLSTDPELTRIVVLGRKLNKGQIEENERRKALYLEKKASIIKEFGVENEYLQPLYERKEKLLEEMFEVIREIKAIKA